MDAIKEVTNAPALQPDEDGFIRLQGDWTIKLEPEETTLELSMDCSRTYLKPVEGTPPVWRLLYDWDSLDICFPPTMEPAKVAELVSWYSKGLDTGYDRGKSAGRKQHQDEIKDAVSTLRYLGIGTKLLED